MSKHDNRTIAEMGATETQRELERLRAENAKLREAKAKGGTIGFKVSDKGAVSVYGMGRFPVTLYREQWERLLAHAEDLQAFIAANADKLSSKPAKLAAGEVRTASGAILGEPTPETATALSRDTALDAPLANGLDHAPQA